MGSNNILTGRQFSILAAILAFILSVSAPAAAFASEPDTDAGSTASTTEALKAIWTQMKETGYLNYKIDITSIDSNATDFEALCIEDQKRFLIECLDKNLLYVPFSDIDSEEYAISDEDKRLTKEFYKKN